MRSVRFGIFSAALVVAAVAFAGTTVSDVKVTPLESSRHVEITYMLKGDPAIVTVEIATNGIPVGAKASRSVVGDANIFVVPSDTVAKRISWSADDDLPGCVLADVSATVKVWSTANPPNYLALRIVPNEAKHTMYFTCEDALPGGIEDRRWRTDYLLMRRIPHSSDFWRMGAPAGECDARAASEVPHYVKLTKDYYIAVFQMTQRQFTSIWGSNPCPDSQKVIANADLLPVTNVKFYGMLRNTPTATTQRWPEDGHYYTDGTFMGKLKTRTGVAFDLPTDAQWEYACRAGEKAAMYNGKHAGDDSVKDIAWCPKTAGSQGAVTPIPVGSLQPNAWGVYDMLGNVPEWTLDWWSNSSAGYPNNDYHFNANEMGGIVDPVGPASQGMNYRVVRGWGHTVSPSDTATYIRASIRSENRDPFTPYDYVGFRVVCPCPVAANF